MLAVVGAVLWFLNRYLGGAAFVPHLLLVPGLPRSGWWWPSGAGAIGSAGCLGMGLAAALTGFGFQYAVRARVTDPGSLPAGWLLAAVAAWT